MDSTPTKSSEPVVTAPKPVVTDEEKKFAQHVKGLYHHLFKRLIYFI